GNTSSSVAVNPSLMAALAYNGEEEVLYVQSGIAEGEIPLEVFQNNPNPFNNRTDMQFSVSKNMPVEITVFDLSGARVWHSYKQYNKGVHTLVFSDFELGGKAGVFLVHVESAEITEIRKMLRIK